MSAQRFFSPDLLAGKVAVVTGGGSGLGLAIATAFAAVRADVVLASRSAERLARAEQVVAERTGRECTSVPCDVRDEEQVAALHEFVTSRLGQVSLVVNNAAANFRLAAHRMTRRAFQTVVDVDLLGTFTVTREFVPDMMERRSGVVLSIVVPSAERGFPGYSHAGAAKAAIASLTGSWAREWGPFGIRANAIGPGPVPTAGVALNMLGQAPEQPQQSFGSLVDLVPLGRLGTPEDIAHAAVFLCSDAAAWITGANLAVDGGSYLPIGP